MSVLRKNRELGFWELLRIGLHQCQRHVSIERPMKNLNRHPDCAAIEVIAAFNEPHVQCRTAQARTYSFLRCSHEGVKPPGLAELRLIRPGEERAQKPQPSAP